MKLKSVSRALFAVGEVIGSNASHCHSCYQGV